LLTHRRTMPMRRIIYAKLIACAASIFATAALAQSPQSLDQPGWTGMTDPDGVIAARQAMMFELEQLMRPIDSHAAGDAVDPETLRGAAQTIAAVLLAVP